VEAVEAVIFFLCNTVGVLVDVEKRRKDCQRRADKGEYLWKRWKKEERRKTVRACCVWERVENER